MIDERLGLVRTREALRYYLPDTTECTPAAALLLGLAGPGWYLAAYRRARTLRYHARRLARTRCCLLCGGPVRVFRPHAGRPRVQEGRCGHGFPVRRRALATALTAARQQRDDAERRIHDIPRWELDLLRGEI